MAPAGVSGQSTPRKCLATQCVLDTDRVVLGGRVLVVVATVVSASSSVVTIAGGGVVVTTVVRSVVVIGMVVVAAVVEVVVAGVVWFTGAGVESAKMKQVSQLRRAKCCNEVKFISKDIVNFFAIFLLTSGQWMFITTCS